ncbi:hypothetical protein SNC23_02935, partial [Escherichia coli]|nr:hypothetical protein [Escherichia coli]
RSHWSTSKTPSYTKSVSWQHHLTVVDYYYLTGNKPNATVMVDVDRQGFVDLLADRLKFYA